MPLSITLHGINIYGFFMESHEPKLFPYVGVEPTCHRTLWILSLSGAPFEGGWGTVASPRKKKKRKKKEKKKKKGRKKEGNYE
jgi:hypothetical protein